MLRMWWARWSIWIVGCALATAVVIGNAFYQKKQFYPTVVYITKSKPSMVVMYGQALLFVVILGKLFRKLFFGQLRAAEFEHLVERSWYAVTETCLAFTVFRDDFSPKFLALFTLLLFLKSFHWLAEERVDYMERSPVITWVFHVRVLSLLSILLLMDVYFVNVAYQSTITKGASVQLVFGFEYAILTTIVLNTVAKYVFHVIDMQNDTPWENKAVFVLHTEVIIGLFKVILYVVFVMIMVRVYTLPLFALRPTYLALRAFKKAVNDVIMSRRAINNMNNLYPDVTQEELAATDNVCIICREEMTGGAKKLPCNHIFHVSCLRSWFQRQQTCPTCRLNVLRVPAQPAAGAAGVQGGNFNAFINQFPAFGGQGMFRGGQQQQQQQQQAAQPFGIWGGFPQQWIPQQQQQQQQQAGVPQQQPIPPTRGAAGEQNDLQQQPAAGGGDAQQRQQQGVDPTLGARGPQIPWNNTFAPMAPPPFAFRPTGEPLGDFMTAGGPSTPFTFPPMPYIPLVPPPPPLLQTTGLSDDDLVRMEGVTRENIEARLQCLRNVQILLDSAVVQMQQYSAIMSHLNLAATSPPTQSPTSVPSPEEPGFSGTSSAFQSSSQTKSPAAPVVASQVESSPDEKFKEASTTGASSSPTTTGTSTSSSPAAPLSEQDELRKRRLQRFTTTTNQTQASGQIGDE